MGLLIVRGLAVLFRGSGGRFSHAMESPAFNGRATPVHQADIRVPGGYV
jgi:hypothetical protein